MSTKLTLTTKNVYGRVLGYPSCAPSRCLAGAFKVKSFTMEQVRTLRALGFAVVLVAEPLTTTEETPA